MDLVTTISFQRGHLGDQPAVRYYWEGRAITTRTSDKVPSWDHPPQKFERRCKIELQHFHKSKRKEKKKILEHVAWNSPVFTAFGAQCISDAQYQREDCLTEIVRNLFAKYGFKAEEQPHLGRKTPDVHVTKDKLEWYVELKAYHANTICGEPELFQALTYSELAAKEAQKNGGPSPPPKTMLITSGAMVSHQDAAFFEKKPKRAAKRRYGRAINKRGKPKGLDDRDAVGIYKGSFFKLKKKDWSHVSDHHLYWLYKAEEFKDIVFDPSRTDLLVVPPATLDDVLAREGLEKERAAFDRLRTSPLELVMVDPDLLAIK